jgi:hypothetical protein
MRKIDLLKLGFKDTSYTEEEIEFTEFTLKKEKFTIQIHGDNLVEFEVEPKIWVEVPNCKKISHLKQLIKLFH